MRSLGNRHFPLRITSGLAINGLMFSAPPAAIIEAEGEPDDVRMNHSGETEYVYRQDNAHTVIFRCFQNRFVECTYPDFGSIIIDELPVVSARPWIAVQTGVLHVAKFWISPRHCIAYDHRDPANGSITVFRAGHWDHVIQQAQSL
jgi:hypothetical protein